MTLFEPFETTGAEIIEGGCAGGVGAGGVGGVGAAGIGAGGVAPIGFRNGGRNGRRAVGAGAGLTGSGDGFAVGVFSVDWTTGSGGGIAGGRGCDGTAGGNAVESAPSTGSNKDG